MNARQEKAESPQNSSLSTPSDSPWRKSRKANLRIYTPTGVYFIHAKINGRLVRDSLGTTVESVAELLRDKRLKEERQAAKLVAKGAAPDQKAHDFIENHRRNVEAAELKPRSRRYKLEVLETLLKHWPELPALPVREIDRQACRDFGNRLRTKYSAPRFNATIDALRSILELAVEAEVISANAATSIEKKTPKKTKIAKGDLISSEAFDKLVADIRAAGTRQVVPTTDSADFVLFLRFTGIRVSEAAQLEKPHVELFTADRDGISGWLHLPETITKNSEPRTVPIFREIRTIVWTWLTKSLRNTCRVDTMQRGGDFLTPIEQCYNAVYSACHRLGLPRIAHHHFRHLFTTWCLELGVNDLIIAEWLGHRDNGKLLRETYSHVRSEFVMQQLKQIAAKRDTAASA